MKGCFPEIPDGLKAHLRNPCVSEDSGNLWPDRQPLTARWIGPLIVDNEVVYANGSRS